VRWIKSYKLNKAWFIAVISILLTSLLLLSGFNMKANNRDTLVLLGNKDLPPLYTTTTEQPKVLPLILLKLSGKILVMILMF